MDNMHEILEKAITIRGRSALATIIKVEGSAYRKEGASTLFTENGEQIGVISIGCLEEDLKQQAKELMYHPTQHSKRLVYDMSREDDLGWGRGAGCNGKVHILLEKVTPDLKRHLTSVQAKLQQGLKVVAIKNISLIPDAIRTVYKTVAEVKEDEENSFEKRQLNRLIGDKYYHMLTPKSRLFIFGAGTDAEPLARFAAQSGFKVNVWDFRANYLSEKSFPGCTFITDLNNVLFRKDDSVVIMTHDFQKDKQLVSELKQYQFRYFGIMGPRKRTSRLLNDKEIPTFISTPVGLPIGAEGPVEIAISIIADVIRAKRGVAQIDEKQYYRHSISGGTKQ